MSDQSEIIAALESGAATGAGRPLRRIDTHMSHLFLDRDRVYKLKRNLRHTFSDMSSPEARRAACEMELEVNRAFAPELYESVLPVVREPSGALRIGGAGEAIDWVVSMKRFPDGALLTEMAQAGRLTADVIRETGEVIAAFHAAQPPNTLSGHTADYRRIIAGLQRTEAAGAEALGATPASAALFAALDRALAQVSPLIETRRKAGWVRRGHGDLHLRNICVIEGRVTPFDALEFDARLATADVLYDIAFLLMDLRARGLDGLANVAMNAYWDAACQPEDALALLPFFMALRAAVRMAVAVEGGDLPEAERYRQLGMDVLIAERAKLVAIGGPAADRRAEVAATLASELPGPCGARRLSAVEPSKGAPMALAGQAAAALAAGASVIIEGAFNAQPCREAIKAAAGDHSFLGLWLGSASDGEDASPHGLGEPWRAVGADAPLGAVA